MARINFNKAIWLIKTEIRTKKNLWNLNSAEEIFNGIKKATCLIETLNEHIDGKFGIIVFQKKIRFRY